MLHVRNDALYFKTYQLKMIHEVVLQRVRTIRINYYHRWLIYKHTLLYIVWCKHELLVLFLLRRRTAVIRWLIRFHISLHRLQQRRCLLLPIDKELPRHWGVYHRIRWYLKWGGNSFYEHFNRGTYLPKKEGLIFFLQQTKQANLT